MAVFLIERRFADQLETSADSAAEINAVNDEVGVRWLRSFLSLDKRKTFCLYEAADMQAIREAAARAGLPADVIHELSGEVSRDGSFAPL